MFLGNHHLVPLLIPPDTAEVLDLLFSQECQQHCGIVKDNNHVFSNTKNSEDHTSMWDSLHKTKTKVTISRTRKNKVNIKQASSQHNACFNGYTKKDRELFYKHMEHSEKIKARIYQAALAVKEVTNYGKHILKIEEGRSCLILIQIV